MATFLFVLIALAAGASMIGFGVSVIARSGAGVQSSVALFGGSMFVVLGSAALLAA